MKVGGWLKCWDLNRFLTGSLKKNCEDFQTKTQKVDGYDHYYIQNKYDKLGDYRFISMVRGDENALEYLWCDV